MFNYYFICLKMINLIYFTNMHENFKMMIILKRNRYLSILIMIYF